MLEPRPTATHEQRADMLILSSISTAVTHADALSNYCVLQCEGQVTKATVFLYERLVVYCSRKQ